MLRHVCYIFSDTQEPQQNKGAYQQCVKLCALLRKSRSLAVAHLERDFLEMASARVFVNRQKLGLNGVGLEAFVWGMGCFGGSL